MSRSKEHERRKLVTWFWVYFVLLLVEGALRKWLIPSLSDVLLLVRDPVAVLILYRAHRHGFLPRTGLLTALAGLLAGFVVLSGLQLVVYGVPAMVLGFGLRTYFLHPPLIFVMGRVLSPRDVRRFVVVILTIAAPIAILMAVQFRAGPYDWINRGAGEGGLQIMSALGKIRPAGPFSYISGPLFYFSLALGCLVASHLTRMRVPGMIQACGWGGVALAAAVSGSRGLVFGFVPVFLAAGVAVVKRPRLVGALVRGAVTAGAVLATVWGTTVVQEGLEVFNARMEASGGPQEMLARSSSTYVYSVAALADAPWLGLGLGLGTNVANAFLGAGYFRFGESEWTRILFEAGPILGAAYLIWRLWLAAWLVRRALRAASVGEVLPIALVAASLTNLLLGPWGQPTTLGFAVIGAGLGLAGCRVAALSGAHRRAAALARRVLLPESADVTRPMGGRLSPGRVS